MRILLILALCLMTIILISNCKFIQYLKFENRIYEKQIIELQTKNQIFRNFQNNENRLQMEVDFLRKENMRLQQIVSGYRHVQSNTSTFSIPVGTVEAVKYAMKRAHPDNGGNAEDFIRFKKCYEELTGR